MRTPCIVPARTRMTHALPVHPWSASGFIQVSGQATGVPDRHLVFPVENSVENGGSRASDAAKSQVGQINEFYIYAIAGIFSI